MVAQPTTEDGHGGTGGAVEDGVSNTQSAVGPSPTRPVRPFRCFRHRAWMAACADCRKAHAPHVTKRDEPAPADASR